MNKEKSETLKRLGVKNGIVVCRDLQIEFDTVRVSERSLKTQSVKLVSLFAEGKLVLEIVMLIIRGESETEIVIKHGGEQDSFVASTRFEAE